MLLNDLLARFAEVREESDGGYLALCPAHADSRPSLRIWRGDDQKARITCRAGCLSEDVIKAVGLKWSDMFNVTGEGATVSKDRPELVGVQHMAALTLYVDATSAALLDFNSEWGERARAYLADRFGLNAEQASEMYLGVDPGVQAPKLHRFPHLSRSYEAFPRLTVPLNDFAGQHRGLQGRDLSGDCPGRWLSLMNPKGYRWSPYGVFRGGGNYGVTLVAEGPGDALTAASVGYDAVAVRGASLAGNPVLVAELASGMRNTQVIVAGDNDAAGNQFTQRLVDGLHEHGIEVYTLEIPRSGWDLTDWRGDNPEEFPNALHAAVKLSKAVRDPETRQAEQRFVEVAGRTGTRAVSEDQGKDAARVLNSLKAQYGEGSDVMNAHALVAWSNGRIKFAKGLGYYVWGGKVWERSEVKVRQEIHRMGSALMLAGDTKGAKGFTMTSNIESLMAELRSVPSVHVEAEDFDAQPHLLTFRNGVVDLRSGKLREHSKSDMLTYMLPVDYVEGATAPRWETFLTEIFPGMPEMVDYTRRLVGYGITGNTSEQCFAVLWGRGSNGKSVLTDTLSEIFGPITETTPFDTFEDKGSSGGIPNDLAALRGSRLVMASEGEASKAMSEAVLKRVTGKDKVTARFLRQEFFTFSPTFLIMLATNHKPKFKGQDEGLWRRVKLIPFKRHFALHERDFDLDKKLLAEHAGIIAWAVRGAVEWYAGGLQDPEVISQATTDYRETQDALAGFFPGVLERADGEIMPGADAYNDYRDWCEAEGLPSKEIWSRRVFYEAMEERQVTRKRSNKGVALVGIRRAGATPKAGPGIFSGE